MARKAKTKSANNDSTAPTFRASDATKHFLAAMNQNHRVASSFLFNEYIRLVPIVERSAVMDNLMQMKFRAILDENPTTPMPPPSQVADSQIDEDDIHEIIDAFKIVGPWCEKFTPTIVCDDVYFKLKRLVGLIADLFDLTPGLHQCLAPSPPPPPCSCLHCNDEDIPMEPTAPTCAFSEAASQTPVPSHEASTPSPLPAAVASIPPAGPRGHASYTGAAAKNLNPAAPPFMRGPPRAPAAQPLAQAQQPVSSKRLKRPFYVTRGPSRRQFFIEVPNIPKDTSLPSMVKSANNALARAKSTLWVDSAHFSPCGIMCATVNVPSTSDLNIIEATLSSRLLGAHVCIPVSRSFIKIVDVPFFKPGTTEPIPSAEVGAQLQRSIIPSDYVVHWHFVQNSPKAEFATVWIDLSDSQRGTHASQLIGRRLFLNEAEVLIKGAKAHTRMPQCQ
ncbi:hypothetical protein P691DRAFT_766094 [Macrolepiota fuliginosa MF-IS2]|uniref:Uncharacterized protein n=1 Tax=Macrolepiota fuliginosa MF-IS2 TaxID=1400762 RepID=A0A9P5WZ84_9AGAR|nr:hypothetical protein P691DRAFT_766094 [Macrolepiota fuliginosa MF-IS2]